jgi:hypothetical protein
VAGQLIPHPDMAPSLPKRLTPQQRVEEWLGLVEFCDELLRASLHRRFGTDHQVESEYRRLADLHAVEKLETYRRMARRFERLAGAR